MTKPRKVIWIISLVAFIAINVPFAIDFDRSVLWLQQRLVTDDFVVAGAVIKRPADWLVTRSFAGSDRNATLYGLLPEFWRTVPAEMRGYAEFAQISSQGRKYVRLSGMTSEEVCPVRRAMELGDKSATKLFVVDVGEWKGLRVGERGAAIVVPDLGLLISFSDEQMLQRLQVGRKDDFAPPKCS